MADVQTEHGYVKIANRIVEAILDAKFTGTQVRILLALVRLTYGWRRRTVAISILDLAKLCGLAGTGGFRRALYDLIHNGVVLELVEGKATVYAIQKDYVQWRAFGGNEGKLAARWDKRPTHDDALLRHVESSGQLTLQGSSNEPETAGEADSDSTLQGSDPIRNDPVGFPGVPHRVRGSTPQGNETGDKSLFGETVDGGKDRKDNEIQTAQATATADTADPELEPDCEFARGIATAANNAIGLRWTNARTLHWSSATQLASDLRRMGV
jgi:phage replication O-like protein O